MECGDVAKAAAAPTKRVIGATIVSVGRHEKRPLRDADVARAQSAFAEWR